MPLTALALPGFFDHQFDPTPAELVTGKSPDTAPCVSASAFSAEVPVAAAMIGDAFAVTTGPGELFATLTNTIEESSPAAVTLPLAQTTTPWATSRRFELDEVGHKVLETSLELLADLATR